MRFVVGIGSEETAAAIRVFVEAAKPAAEVMAIAVVPRLRRLSTILGLPRGHRNQQVRELRRLEQSHASELLAAFKSEVERPGLTVEASVQIGNPAEELIKAAQRWRADFVVVTKRESANDATDHLGHVAARVARYSDRSVLLLDPKKPAPRIFLLATDGSPQAELAGTRLLQIPVKGSPTLLACAVVPSCSPVFVKTGSLEYREYQRILSEIEAQTQASAQQILDRAVERLVGASSQVRKLVYTGDTAEVLLNTIREFDVDLLALGAKGMSSAAEFLMGSVTLKLLDRAPCSVLVSR